MEPALSDKKRKGLVAPAPTQARKLEVPFDPKEQPRFR